MFGELWHQGSKRCDGVNNKKEIMCDGCDTLCVKCESMMEQCQKCDCLCHCDQSCIECGCVGCEHEEVKEAN